MTKQFVFNTDQDAWDVLSTFNITHNGGHIQLPNPNYVLSAVENSAIDYLCEEWDYAFDSRQPHILD